MLSIKGRLEMDNFNNNNNNGYNSSPYGGNQQGGYNNGFYHYNGAQGSYYSGNNEGYGRPMYGAGVQGTNEYSYHPADQNKKKSHVMPAVIAVVCVFVIGIGSVAGYNLFAAGRVNDDSSSIAMTKQAGTPKKNNASAASTVDRTDLPTIEQLSTPDDALSIPDIVELVSPSVVGISCTGSGYVATGTGIILSEDGYIITNAHVVSKSVDGSGISVMLHDSYNTDKDKDALAVNKNNFIDAELVGRDTQSDIAVLKINKKDLKPATMGKSSEIKVGEASIVIGNPLGFELKGSVTAGIISATDRTLSVEDRTMKLIQTDASINSGNSGGPLINAYGQVIGITSVKVSSTYGEGLGFAIPIDEALPIINDLMEYGYVTGRPTLGWSGKNITEIYSQYYKVPQGFYVSDMTSGGPAEQAGIQIGDIIVGVNGTTITTVEEINKIVEQFKAGDTVTIAYYRNDKLNSVDVVLGDAAETGKGADTQSDNYSGRDGYDNYDDYDDYDLFRRFYGYGF